MLSPYRIPQSSNNHTKEPKSSNHTEQDFKMTSNDLKMISNEALKNQGNELKGSDLSDNQNVGSDLSEQAFLSN